MQDMILDSEIDSELLVAEIVNHSEKFPILEKSIEKLQKFWKIAKKSCRNPEALLQIWGKIWTQFSDISTSNKERLIIALFDLFPNKAENLRSIEINGGALSEILIKETETKSIAAVHFCANANTQTFTSEELKMILDKFVLCFGEIVSAAL